MNKREERFLRVVSDRAETPGPFHPALESIENTADIERIMVIPKQEYPLMRTFLNFQLPFGWRVVPQRVLVFFTDRLEIYALEPSGSVESEQIRMDEIFSVGIGSHLLYAYLDVSWFSGGKIHSRRIEFNAVGEAIMRERLDQIRRRVSQTQPTIVEMDQVQFALQDKTIPIKFRNYATFSLIPGEKIAQIFYQPAVHSKKLLGPPLSPNRLFTLTDRHLIVFDEDASVAANYSIVTHFYPLRFLRETSFQSDESGDTIQFRFTKDGMETVFSYPMQKERLPRTLDQTAAAAASG